MADDADRAQAEIEAEVAHARLAAQAQFRLVATGHCHNCEEHLERQGQLFCDQECARDYELRERALAWQGD